jgi:hypothetical protein
VQGDVVDNLRRIGYHVLHIHILKGCCDLIIGKEKRLCYVELKASDKLPKKFFKMSQADKDKYLETKLTDDEKVFKQQIDALGLPYIIAIIRGNC